MDKLLLAVFIILSIIVWKWDLPILSRYSKPMRVWIVFLFLAFVTGAVLFLFAPDGR